MSNIKSEFTFTLTNSIKFTEGGSQADGTTLLLKAPSNKHRRESAILKQGFFRAVKDMQQDNAPENVDTTAQQDDEDQGEGIVSLISMSDVDLVKYQESFRDLLLNDVCYVNSTVKLTAPLYDSLSEVDTSKLMGDYLANFLLASQLQKMKAK